MCFPGIIIKNDHAYFAVSISCDVGCTTRTRTRSYVAGHVHGKRGCSYRPLYDTDQSFILVLGSVPAFMHVAMRPARGVPLYQLLQFVYVSEGQDGIGENR